MKLVAALATTLVCTSAAADQLYLTASLTCNFPKSELLVSFRSFWNEAGERAVADLGIAEVDPRKLISFSQDTTGKYSISTRSESKTCRIGSNSYIVEFSPLVAPRFHPEGFCATRIGATVSIRLDGKLVATAGVDACTEEGLVVEAVTVSPGRQPRYTEVSAKQFYGI